MKLRDVFVGLVVLIAIAAAVSPRARAQDRPHWNIEFVPNEAGTVTVNINNQGWTTWTAANGRVRWYLPMQWANLQKIHVHAAASPRGKNASIRVYWDDTLRQVMDFDDDEDHDVDRP